MNERPVGCITPGTCWRCGLSPSITFLQGVVGSVNNEQLSQTLGGRERNPWQCLLCRVHYSSSRDSKSLWHEVKQLICVWALMAIFKAEYKSINPLFQQDVEIAVDKPVEGLCLSCETDVWLCRAWHKCKYWKKLWLESWKCSLGVLKGKRTSLSYNW